MEPDSTAITADDLIGKTVLIGIMRESHTGEAISQEQYVCLVISVGSFIHFRLQDGHDFKLPPDLSSFHRARPGVYRLRTTRQEVSNPDFTTTWTVRAPKPEDRAETTTYLKNRCQTIDSLISTT